MDVRTPRLEPGVFYPTGSEGGPFTGTANRPLKRSRLSRYNPWRMMQRGQSETQFPLQKFAHYSADGRSALRITLFYVENTKVRNFLVNSEIGHQSAFSEAARVPPIFPQGYFEMKISLRVLSLVSCAAGLLAAAGTAHAGTVNGTVYYGIGSQYQTGGVTQATLADAISSATVSGTTTFTSNTVDFEMPKNPTVANTMANFLTQGYNPASTATETIAVPNNPAGTNILTGAALANSQMATSDLIVLTGSAYLVAGQTYDVFHDDGISLYFNGSSTDYLPANGADQTVAGNVSNTLGQYFVWDGPTGLASFELLYVSNSLLPSTLDAPSGVLGASAPLPTPEPSSFVLLGSGLLAAAGVIRRRMTV